MSKLLTPHRWRWFHDLERRAPALAAINALREYVATHGVEAGIDVACEALSREMERAYSEDTGQKRSAAPFDCLCALAQIKHSPKTCVGQPPIRDHVSMWKKGRLPTTVVMQLYNFDMEDAQRLSDWCEEKGLTWGIHPRAWHYPLNITMIEISKEGGLPEYPRKK